MHVMNDLPMMSPTTSVRSNDGEEEKGGDSTATFLELVENEKEKKEGGEKAERGGRIECDSGVFERAHGQEAPD